MVRRLRNCGPGLGGILLAVCFVVVTGSVASAENTVVVEPADGPGVSDLTLQSWSGDKLQFGGTPVRSWSPDDLVRVSFPRSVEALAESESLVLLANGDRLVLRPVGIFDDVLTATWVRYAGRPPVKLPLETIAAVLFELPAARDERTRLFSLLETLPSGEDTVLLSNGDRVQGELERLDGTFVQIRTNAGLLKLDRSRIQALRMNPELTTSPPVPNRHVLVTLRDATRFTAVEATLAEEEVRFVSATRLEITLSVADLVECQFFGPRVQSLSNRTPAHAVFTPFLSQTWPVQHNRNVRRGPLSMRGKDYAIGLGVHSRTRLTYDLQAADQELRATVGIDDCAGGQGSVRFLIELDGRRVWESPELTGRSQPLAIPPVSLNGSGTLTLLVDFGANADVADYANWCDARIIRSAPAR